MSYDLNVFVPRIASLSELAAAVEDVTGLAVDRGSPRGGGITVVRGVRGRYCCTVEDPAPIEAADLEDAIVTAVPGVSHVYQILVEGSSEADVPFAVRFARRLAVRLNGIVEDPQTQRYWADRESRTVTRPTRDTRVDLVEVDWFVPAAAVSKDTVHTFLDLCRRHLPEALPRRFGHSEPFRAVFGEVGAEGFLDRWAASDDSLFWSAELPCLHGHAYGNPDRDPREEPGWELSLSMLREPLAQHPIWRAALRGLFVAVAEHLGAFYAQAEVTRNTIWHGRSIWYDETTESAVSTGGHWWYGLPPYPVWWSWYGVEYLPLVEPLLDSADTIPTTRGLFHAATEEPGDRTQLERRWRTNLSGPPPAGADGDNRTPWLSEDLLVTVARTDRPPKYEIEIKRRIPESLEYLAGRRSPDDTEYYLHDPRERVYEELVAALRVGEKPIVADLRRAGIEVDHLDDLRWSGGLKLLRKAATVRVLTAHLSADLHDVVRSNVIMLLGMAGKRAAAAWPALKAEYLDTSRSSVRRLKIANALSDTNTEATVDELIELATDPANGPSRSGLLEGLRKSDQPRALQCYEALIGEFRALDDD